MQQIWYKSADEKNDIINAHKTDLRAKIKKY